MCEVRAVQKWTWVDFFHFNWTLGFTAGRAMDAVISLAPALMFEKLLQILVNRNVQ